MFQFIGQKLGIKLENWEEDALENRLDRLGLAFIEFNEFNEFSGRYGLDWGEELLANDLEEQLEKKLKDLKGQVEQEVRHPIPLPVVISISGCVRSAILFCDFLGFRRASPSLRCRFWR